MIHLENLTGDQYKADITEAVQEQLQADGYTIAEKNIDKPWGSYLRLANTDADAFIAEYFPGLTGEEARLGIEGAELSPKILIVAPNQRLSWQYHFRRAERWAFLTEGAYRKGMSDTESDLIVAQPGEVVQFAESERHRLEGIVAQYVFVAEIWQHTQPGNPSNEDDIVRLQDDYTR